MIEGVPIEGESYNRDLTSVYAGDHSILYNDGSEVFLHSNRSFQVYWLLQTAKPGSALAKLNRSPCRSKRRQLRIKIHLVSSLSAELSCLAAVHDATKTLPKREPSTGHRLAWCPTGAPPGSVV